MNDTPLTIGNSSVTAPVIDEHSAQILETAIEALTAARSGETYNAADRLTSLASLAAQAQALIPDAIADAVDQDFTWTQITHSAGLTPAAARRRHAARTRRPPTDID
jgi:hypothetical protein